MDGICSLPCAAGDGDAGHAAGEVHSREFDIHIVADPVNAVLAFFVGVSGDHTVFRGGEEAVGFLLSCHTESAEYKAMLEPEGEAAHTAQSFFQSEGILLQDVVIRGYRIGSAEEQQRRIRLTVPDLHRFFVSE